MKLWKFFFLLAVGFIQFDSLTSSSIKAQVNSSLEESWNIKFDSFVKRSEGLALYATDSSNRLMILFASESIIFAFNSNSTIIELNKICGCSICKNFFISFDIVKKMKEVTFHTECRGKKEEIKINYKIYKKWYKFPIIKETKNKTYFWMANTEIFKNDQNYIIYPSKVQLYGCLHTFSYKNTTVLFTGNNTDFQSTCMKTCLPKYCNGGSCLEQRSKAPICDCSFTAKNGHLCLRDFKDYSFGNNTSLEVPYTEEIIPFKLSWRHENITNYCLLELILKDFNIIIIVDQNRIKYNNEIIGDIITNQNYFMNIIFLPKYVIVMFKKTKRQIEMIRKDNIRINIGFSNFGIHDIFKGKYDINYNTSQIRPLKESVDNKRNINLLESNNLNNTVPLSRLLSEKISTLSKKFYILPIIFIGILGFLFVLFKLANIKKRLWKKILKLNKLQIIEKNKDSKQFLYQIKVQDVYDTVDYQYVSKDISLLDPHKVTHDVYDESPVLPQRALISDS